MDARWLGSSRRSSAPEVFGVYVILTEPVVGYEACARAAIDEGVRYLQLRMKRESRDEIVDTARRIEELTRNTDTRFIVNDDPEIAAEVDADGVHLGREDMPLEDARRLWTAPEKVFGLSTHNEEQARQAVAQAPNYIGVGPVFPTPTKAKPDPALGVERAGAIIRSTPLTAVAIGGINEGNLAETLAHGAVNFCAVRPIMRSPHPAAVIRRMMRIWGEHTP